MDAYLEKCKKQGITAIPALGYQMISETLPTKPAQLIDLVKRGTPWEKMNKLSIFNPNKIRETHQKPGRHKAAPTGKVKYPETDELLNLHFKYLSFENTFKRYQELNSKLGSYDRGKGWGQHYAWEKEKIHEDWKNFWDASIENIHQIDSHQNHHSSPHSRWWRAGKPLGKKIKEIIHESFR